MPVPPVVGSDLPATLPPPLTSFTGCRSRTLMWPFFTRRQTERITLIFWGCASMATYSYQRCFRMAQIDAACKKTANRGKVTEMLLNLLRRNLAKNPGGFNLHIAGATLMGWLGNAWGGHFYLSW